MASHINQITWERRNIFVKPSLSLAVNISERRLHVISISKRKPARGEAFREMGMAVRGRENAGVRRGSLRWKLRAGGAAWQKRTAERRENMIIRPRSSKAKPLVFRPRGSGINYQKRSAVKRPSCSPSPKEIGFNDRGEKKCWRGEIFLECRQYHNAAYQLMHICPAARMSPE